MGRRKITIRQSVADSIAKAAWFIESKGMLSTAEKFSDAAYDYIELLTNDTLIHAPCRDPQRNLLGLKCKIFRKNYTIVFFETDKEVTVCEFVISKLIKW